MALKRNERYPGRFDNPTAAHPQGAFKNRTTPTAKDGSYLERDWANDWDGFFSSLLVLGNITPSGSVDEVGNSQYYNALVNVIASSIPQSSETVSGALKLSTQALTDARVDDLTAITPKKLGNGFLVGTVGTGWYLKLPSFLGGYIIQAVDSGQINLSASQIYSQDLFYPIALPNEVITVISSSNNQSVSCSASPSTLAKCSVGFQNLLGIAASATNRVIVIGR